MRRVAMVYFFACGVAFADENPAPLCYRELAAETHFASIAKKLPLADFREISFENLADKTLPTEKERKLIVEWVEARKPCFQKGLTYSNENYPSQISAIAVEADNNLTAIIASLFNKEISYGAANKKIQAVVDGVRNRVTIIMDQIRRENNAKDEAIAQLQIQHDNQERIQRDIEKRFEEQMRANSEIRMQQQQAQANYERRQHAIQMLKNFQPYQAPAPYQIPIRPNVTTNCSQIGNQWTCNSR